MNAVLLRTIRCSAAIVAAVAIVALVDVALVLRNDNAALAASETLQDIPRLPGSIFRPTPVQWESLTIASVEGHVFRPEFSTEGKIAVDEDTATPVFSPYAGRVVKISAKPGDRVVQGQELFVVEATDTVQGLNDFVAAGSAVMTGRSKLNLAEIVEKRARDLYAGKAVPLKDWQQAQADLTGAQNDMRSAESAQEAAQNRLKIAGFKDGDIAAFREKRQINPNTSIPSPIAGTVVQRKLGPGQYIASGATDPAFVIGDLSTVWLTAFVRETDAYQVSLDQDASFTVLALPGRVFRARINYIASAFDPVSRRLTVRAKIDNKSGLLRPEMFASVTLYSGSDQNMQPSPSLPLSAVIYEGDTARVWVANEDRSLSMRQVQTGVTEGDRVQVFNGVNIGDRVVMQGTLFIDRAANGS